MVAERTYTPIARHRSYCVWCREWIELWEEIDRGRHGRWMHPACAERSLALEETLRREAPDAQIRP